MEVAEAEPYPMFLAPNQSPEPVKKTGRKWMKHWVPQDTILGSGSCMLLKWITEDVLNTLQSKRPVVEEQEPEEEHEVVYLCTYEGCGKVFPEATGLRKHAHVHGEKQFICQYEGCGKRFVDSSKLKRHFLIHTGEKHFICPFEGCGKAFSLDFNLRSHMRTHTGENYHKCPYEDCGKRYAHEYKLKAHMRSFHDKNIAEVMATSPGTDTEREVIVPKYTPAPAPTPAVLEKPFACPFEGCSKRYIHEYKLNLHLKNAHQMMHDNFEDSFHPGRGGPQGEESFHQVGRGVAQPEESFPPGRGGSQGEDDIEDDSEQDIFQEVVPKYYEQVSKVSEPAPKKRVGANNTPGKGKLRIISKPVLSGAKRKRANLTPAEPGIKLHVKHVSKGGMNRLDFKPEVADDSEETEDEDRENTEEEDNVKHRGGSNIQHMRGVMGEEDDEETEDDMD